MQVVVTADDFGWDEDTVLATIECLERGLVRNASIMANVPATADALAYAAGHPEHGYGVHLTLTRDEEERPVLPAEEVPDLVDGEGRFLSGREAQISAFRGRFPAAQVEAELAAQLALVADHGITLDHVDSHKHLHKFPVIAAVLPSLLPRFGISRVRNVQDIFLGRTMTRPTAWLGRRWRRRLESDWMTSDHFFMADGEIGVPWWDAVPLDLGEAVVEVGAHPGTASGWRAHEFHGLEQLATRLAESGISPVRWRDLTSPGRR